MLHIVNWLLIEVFDVSRVYTVHVFKDVHSGGPGLVFRVMIGI